nr:MAG TPA: hypothetical protein [Caudoviricetes sp.]
MLKHVKPFVESGLWQPLLLLFIRLSPVVCLPFLLLDGSGLCWSDCLLHTALLF